MKRLLTGVATVLLLVATTGFAYAANGQQVVSNDVVRATSTVQANTVVARIANIAGGFGGGGFSGGGGGGFGFGGAPGASLTPKDSKAPAFAFNAGVTEDGLSAGEKGTTFGVWGLGMYTNFSNGDEATKYDADLYTAMVGGDMRVTDDLLIGVALGYEYLDLDKKYGGGGSLETDGSYTIMPYLGYTIIPGTVLDAAFGYTSTEYEDNDGTATGDYDSDRYVSSIGLSQYFSYDAWDFSGRIGYLYVHGDQSDYDRSGANVDNSDSFLGQLSVGAKAAYNYEGWQPYVGLNYLLDTTTSARPVNSDYDEFEGLFGINCFAIDQWKIGAEFGASFDRSQYESYRSTLTVRYEF
ncbi:MAG: autotransporter outer membrane beta-barrel domain-containing protein [Syntrophotalea acetylenica]|nr:autotransporter outer membrane beta-barrel domain-containing protein [Syntrophotalea acetylenica]